MEAVILVAVLGFLGWQTWQREQERKAEAADAALAAERLAVLERQALEETRPVLSLPDERPETALGQIVAGTEVGFLIGDLITESGASAAEAALWGGAAGAALIGPWGALLAAGIGFQTAHAARMVETAQYREIEFMLSNAEWREWRRLKNTALDQPLNINAENSLHTYEIGMVRKYRHPPEANMPGPREFAERVRAWMQWDSWIQGTPEGGTEIRYRQFTNPTTVPMLATFGIVRPPKPVVEVPRVQVVAGALSNVREALSSAFEPVAALLPSFVTRRGTSLRDLSREQQADFFATGGSDTWASIDDYLAGIDKASRQLQEIAAPIGESIPRQIRELTAPIGESIPA